MILLLGPAFSRLPAQSPEYQFSTLNFANGLSNNHITSLYKDKRGFMWFGTMSGLDRYDGYEFRIFRHDQRDPYSIGDNYIEQIFEGPDGKMWVQSRSSRFNIYDLATDRFDQDYAGYLRKHSLPEFWLLGISKSKTGYWFVYRDSGIFHMDLTGKLLAVRQNGKDPAALSPAMISDAREDQDGNCWVVHQNGLIEKVDGRTHAVVFRTTELEKVFGKNQFPCGIYIDRQQDIWVYAAGYFKGVWRYRPATGRFTHYSAGTGPNGLSSDVIYTALQDEKGKIWLATDHGGVDILDKTDGSVRVLTHIEDDRKSLAENSIPAMILDSSGTVWLGTFKSGINYYHQNGIQFPLFRHHPRDPHSLSFDDVNKFVEDSAGNIWIGSNGGGLIYFNRRNNSFRQFLNDPSNPNSLSNNIIVSLLIDHDNRLWIGTYFGGLDCYDGKRFIHYRHDDRRPGSLADDRVMCLYEDSEHDLWVGTLAGGLDRLDRRKNKFEHHTSSQPNSIFNNYVSSVLEDREHNLWVATAYGIDVLDRRNGRFTHYSSERNQLSTDNVILLFLDSRDNVWVATRDGLNLFLPEKNSFQSFTTENGLPDNTIRSIVEDRQHALWVSTANGLSRITVTTPRDRPTGPVRISCRNYHEKDGLQGREFNERTALATRDGFLAFGGPNGFNLFRPEQITNTSVVPPIVLTGLDIFNKTVHVGEKMGNQSILDQALTETDRITLTHSDDVFSIEFAALDFIENPGDKYAYTLEGFNKNWLVTDARSRKATYTNLDAGTYTFKVKASDEDGQWYDREAKLTIVILPPFWKTPFAYIVYVLLLAGTLFLARRMVIRKARMRFALEQERRETRRLHEIDLMKIRFFTNMSHELRTPLSLILAPVDKLIAGPVVSDPRQQYDMIRRNARRLLHLVNQLLDFRKMEVNELRLHPRQGDILTFVREICFSFIDLAERKNIAFTYTTDNESLLTSFDHDKIERILFNLLSNAFKFTPANGKVNVAVTTESAGTNAIVTIKVSDTGIGIAPDKLERIFERFFQSEVPDTILNQGSGIGLAITQEFVRMHRGQLAVESKLNEGSCFTVRLPFTPAATAFTIHRAPEGAAGPQPHNGVSPGSLNGHPAASLNEPSPVSLNEPSPVPLKEPSPVSLNEPSPAPLNEPSPVSLDGPFSASHNEPSPASFNEPSPGPLNGRSPDFHNVLPMDRPPKSDFAHGPDGSSQDSGNDRFTSDAHPFDPSASGAPHDADRSGGNRNAGPRSLAGRDKRPTILIVEDNDDFRFYLKDNLRQSYTIIEAADGREGWRKALAHHPDLIVSDISMPAMNGMELCKKISADQRTAQIPVILLTAMTGEGAELNGLRTGAIDYVIKPFNFELLLSKIGNVLTHSATLRRTYQRQVQAVPAAVEIESAGEIFVKGVLEEIEKNMSNPDFSVGELSSHFHSSRSTFYKRLLLLTGKTPIEFIRHIRLKRAAELLEKSQLTVSEIAYTVGFNNPKNFSQYFKEEFDRIPSAYRSEKREAPPK
ncbi:MAG TPA: two-component regulator propeller domain-containing protein [Puia sp.]|nr:two-component regulator propeller domain-containing protein [Puia sp.]